MEESAAPSHVDRPDVDRPDIDRLALLEQQVRLLTSRLAGWVETQLGRAVDDRRVEFQGLRSDLQAVVDAQLVAVRGEIASMVTDATGRLEAGQEDLRARLATVAERAQEGRAPAGSDVEQRVRQAMSRLSESVETRLAELAHGREADAQAVRRELTAELDERLLDAGSRTGAGLAAVQERLADQAVTLARRVEEVAGQAASASTALVAVASDAAAATARTEAFEQRVKSAMGRLTDSVETRLAESVATRQIELDRLRVELGERTEGVATAADRTANELRAALAQQAAELRAETATVADAARIALGRAQTRLETLEEHDRRVEDRIAQMVEARVAQVLGRQEAALDARAAAMEARLAQQGSEGRHEIASAVDAAHKRFLLSQERLETGLEAVAAQVTSVAASVEILDSTVASDGARVEALEVHTRRTDAKLTELVEEKFARLSGERGPELAAFRENLEAAVAARIGQLQVEVSSALDITRRDLAEGTAHLVAQRAELQASLTAQMGELRTELDTTREMARTELVAGAVQLHEQRIESTAAVEERTAAAAAELEARLEAARHELSAGIGAAREELAASIDTARREMASGAAEIEAQQAALAAQAADMAAALDAHAQLASVVDRLARKVDRAQERVRDRVKALSERIEETSAAMAAASKKEAGALAPLRSDVRTLHAEVAALAETVASLSRRKAPVKAPPAPRIPAVKAEARRRARLADQ